MQYSILGKFLDPLLVVWKPSTKLEKGGNIDRIIIIITIDTKFRGSCHNMTCVDGHPFSNIKYTMISLYQLIFTVKIGTIWYNCTADGPIITIKGGGNYTCPVPANRWCSDVPNYDSWPTFESITPSKAFLGEEVTVIGKHLYKYHFFI
jgi:hypothetical protein